jgi:hypothetical protein
VQGDAEAATLLVTLHNPPTIPPPAVLAGVDNYLPRQRC